MANPEAFYDTLYIVRRLTESLHGVTAGEVHLFGYLSRLLGLFRGTPIADWGYRFTRTNWGAPFSRDLADALNELQVMGHLRVLGQDAINPLSCSDEGISLVDMLDSLEVTQWRKPYLEASCSSAAAFPVFTIRQAIRSEPTLKSASRHVGAQELLSGPSLELLYEQFEALRAVLGEESRDLFVPSSVWLSYLIEKSSDLQYD